MTVSLRLRMSVQNAVLRWFAVRGDELAELAVGRTTDPFAVHDRIRARGPVVRSRMGLWAVPGHALCSQVLRDPRFGVAQQPKGVEERALDLSLLELDPPDHTRLRRLAAPAFRPRLVGGYRDRMQTVTSGLLDDVDPAGFDVVRDLASPLPITVITDLLGVRDVDQERIGRYGQAVGQALSGVSSVRQLRELEAAAVALSALFTDLMARRRVDPGDDLVSTLVTADDAPTADELVSLCQLLLVAGFETTVNLIGSAVHRLLEHPEQWAALVADPGLAAGAVEETLRHQSPVQATTRMAYADVELGGVRVPAGGVVVLLLGAAGRDPEVFDDPHRFDLTRTAPEHLAFSSGIHYCLGAALARAEGEVALRTLAERFPDLHRAGPPRHRTGFTLRGLTALPVTAGGPASPSPGRARGGRGTR